MDLMINKPDGPARNRPRRFLFNWRIPTYRKKSGACFFSRKASRLKLTWMACHAMMQTKKLPTASPSGPLHDRYLSYLGR